MTTNPKQFNLATLISLYRVTYLSARILQMRTIRWPRHHVTNLTFNLSPLTISSFCAINSGISQVQLTYRPASQSLFSLTRKTRVSALSSAVSIKTCIIVSETSPAFNCNNTYCASDAQEVSPALAPQPYP